MKPEILPEVELVQVLLYLSKKNNKTRQMISNYRYCNAIDRYFEEFRDHSAVRLTTKLIDDQSFIHIQPLKSILSLDLILANPKDPMYEWALTVKQFQKDTQFSHFFDLQKPYYDYILVKLKDCAFDQWIPIIEQYFRCEPLEFHLVICPFAGNYGFILEQSGVSKAYTVRCMPYYDKEGNEKWEYDLFAKGIAHEYAHCFVNPVVEARKAKLFQKKKFFASHSSMDQGYNVDYAVMNEYWVRAFAIRFMEMNHQLFPGFDIAKEYERQRETFIYIDRFVELLKKFESGSESFDVFYERVLKEI